MVDNVGVTPGTGATFATDDIGGIQYPRVKISQGADGAATDVSSAAPLNVTLANSSAIPAGTNNIGDVDVLTVGGQTPAFGAGATSAATQRVVIANDQLASLGQAAMAASTPVVIASNQSAVATTPAGNVAHDAVDSGNPVKVGGRARSSEITAVASGDRSDFITDLVGKQIVLPYANPENFVSGAITTAMTGTTSTSLIAAPGAGLRNYITQITVSNAHATVGTDVAIQDGSGGTTLYTIPAAANYGGAVINFPTPLRQTTANTALFCANVTTGASTKVSASGYKGA